MSTNDQEWRWADPSGQQRLVRTDELRAALAGGVIPSNAPVWQRGWSGWKPAHEVPELQSSALAAANGVLPNVPPPPLFVVAAQSEFEGSPKADRSVVEPPAPPRYVPMASLVPSVPPPVSVRPVAAEPPAMTPPAPAPPPAKIDPVMVIPKPTRPERSPSPGRVEPVKTGPRKSIPPPLPKKTSTKSMPPPVPKRGASQRPPAMAASPVAEPRSIPTMFGIPALPNPSMLTPSPDATDENLALPDEEAWRPPTSRPPARPTLPVFPAPPPMTELPPSEVKAAAQAHHEERPAPRPATENKFPTLIQFGGAPESEAPPPSDSAPIVVPPPEPSLVTGAVTRPPPWGEGAVGMSADIPKSGKVPGIAPENIEELSGSMIVPDESSRSSVRPMELSSSDLASEANLVAVRPAPLAAAERRGGTIIGLAPPPQTAIAAKHATIAAKKDEADLAALATPPSVRPPRVPIPAPSGARTHDLRELVEGRPPWVLVVAGAFGALIVIGLVGLVVRIAKGGSSSDDERPVTTASQSATVPTAPTTPPSTTASAAPPPVASSAPMTCSLAGTAKTLAPRAQVGSGIEVRALDGSVALGFATGPKEGLVQLVDPATLTSSGSASVRSTDTIRRVVSLKTRSGTVDTDRKGDRLQGRRAVVGDPLIDLGSDGAGLVWAPHGKDKGITLWPLDGTGNVEALRGERAANGNTYVAFRQGAAIFYGVFGGSPLAPIGNLSKVEGKGPQVGSPALGVSGDRAFVIWSDRASAQEPWGMRYAVFGAGTEPSSPRTFALPPGGLGEQAMSPGVTGLRGEQFLVLWTEGPVASHQVRGQVFDAKGEPHGSPLTISSDGVNAGQGQAAVLDDGRGVVAFLAANGKNFEVHATPINCVAK